VNQLTWFHCNWWFFLQHIPQQAIPGLHFFLLFFQIVKIVDPNGKLISCEQLRLIHILHQGHLEGKKAMVLPKFSKQVMHLMAAGPTLLQQGHSPNSQ
jgi:hypothetical protein